MNTHGKDFYYLFLNFQITIESIEVQNPYIKLQTQNSNIIKYTYRFLVSSHSLQTGSRAPISLWDICPGGIDVHETLGECYLYPSQAEIAFRAGIASQYIRSAQPYILTRDGYVSHLKIIVLYHIKVDTQYIKFILVVYWKVYFLTYI